MKICYIFTGIDKSNYTGQPAVALLIAKKAQKAHHQVSIISNYTEKIRDLNLKGIDYLFIRGLSSLLPYLRNTINIVKFINKIKPDVIHVKGVLLIIYVWFLNKIFIHRPIVYSIFETPERCNFFLRKLLSFCINRGQIAFVSCEYIKKILVENGVAAKKILVKYTGLKETFLNRIDDYYKTNVDILYFGDSVRKRGFDIICHLAKKLPILKFKVLIRWQDENCKRELEQMRKLPNVTIWYYPYSESLERILLKTKLIILPFRYMGMRPPISLLESMALGKCIVTSSLGGNEEFIKDGENGFIIDFNDLNNVVSKISFLLQHPVIIKKIGKSARKTIKEKHSDLGYERIFGYYTYIKDKFYENNMFGSVGGKNISDKETKILLELLQPVNNDIILDVGTGSGRLARAIVQRTKTEVIGVDPDRKMIDEGKILNKIFLTPDEDKRYHCHLGDGHRLPFNDNKFDKVFCFRVLKYYKNPQRGIDELIRVLKPGGILVLEITNNQSWESMARIFLPRGNKEATDVYYWTKNSTIFNPKNARNYLLKKRVTILIEKPLHKIPPRLYTFFNNKQMNYLFDLLDNLLLLITPKYLFSKSIIYKCIKGKISHVVLKK